MFFSPCFFFSFLRWTRIEKLCERSVPPKGQLLVVGGTRFFCFDCVLTAQSLCCLFHRLHSFCGTPLFPEHGNGWNKGGLSAMRTVSNRLTENEWSAASSFSLSLKGNGGILWPWQEFSNQLFQNGGVGCFWLILSHWIHRRQQLCCTNVNLRQVVI